MQLPPPILSSEIDLRDFPYMPLDVVRLRDSDLSAISSAEGFRAAVLLWCASWHQRPAASLPNDDRSLALLAGFGRDLKAWREVREEALRGFVECSDSRLYHPVVAEKALEAWEARLRQRARTEAARAAKAAKSQKDEGLCDRRSDASVTENVTTSVTENVTGSKGREGKGREIIDNPKILDHGRGRERAKRAAPAPAKISADLEISTGCVAVADEFGLSPEARAAEWRAFLTNKAATGAAISDVAAAFRQWCAKIEKFGAARVAPSTRPQAQSPPMVRVERGTPQADAWEAHYRASGKRGVPWQDGVWRFPSEWPPEISSYAEQVLT